MSKSFWFLFATILLCRIGHPLTANDLASVERFQSKPVEWIDRFEKDTRDQYKTSGEVRWTDAGLMLNPKASLLRVQSLDADFQVEVQFELDDFEHGMQSASGIRIMLSNREEFLISILRVHSGKSLRQVVVSNIDREGPHAEKPKVEELMRMPAFAIAGQTESWKLRYNFGFIELFCNGTKIGTACHIAFSCWLQAVVVTQGAPAIRLTKLSISGQSIGYTKAQRKIFSQIKELRRQAEQQSTVGNLEAALELSKSIIPLNQQCDGEGAPTEALFMEEIGRRLHNLRRHEESHAAYQRAADILEHHLGSDHPSVLLNNIKASGQKFYLGQREFAIAECGKLLGKYLGIAGLKNVSGRFELESLISKQLEQAFSAIQNKSFVDAKNYAASATALQIKLHGPEHSTTIFSKAIYEAVKRLLDSNGDQHKKLQAWFDWKAEELRLAEEGLEKERINHWKGILPLTRELFGQIHPFTFSALGKLSSDRGNEGHFDQSLEMQLELIEIAGQLYGKDSLEYHSQRAALGSLFSMVQRNDEATALLTKECKWYEQNSHTQTSSYAWALLELGRHYSRTDQIAKAIDPLTKSFQLYRSLSMESTENAIRACERLFNAHQALEQIEKAEFYQNYQRNIVSATHGEESSIFVTVLQSEAHRLFMKNQYDEALVKYRQAADLAAKIQGRNSRLYEGVIDGLIDVHRVRGELQEVAHFYEERLNFELNRRESLFNIYSEVEQLERSLQDLSSFDQLIDLTLGGHINARRAYNHVIALKGAVTAKQRSIQLAQSKAESNRLQGQPEIAALERTTTDDLQKLLPPHTAVIDFVEYRLPRNLIQHLISKQGSAIVVAFVLTKDSIHLVKLGRATKLANAWLSWREALDRELGYELKSDEMTLAELTDLRGARVRELIWEPLEQYLDEIRTIVLSPSFHLVTCPFAALPGKRKDHFLIEEYAFTTIAATRLLPDLLERKPASESATMLLIGDIDYNVRTNDPLAGLRPSKKSETAPMFAELLNPDLELATIESAFRRRYKSGKLDELRRSEASEENFRQRIAGTGYVHFDTHGFCLPTRVVRPTRVHHQDGIDGQTTIVRAKKSEWVSGIALAGANHGMEPNLSPESDGVLWAEEMADINFENAELVTLSACQTALGQLVPGQGMLGAQRAIHVAGARSSLTTLWSVEVQSKRAFMGQFYRKLWDEGLSKAEALQQAQILMLRKYRWLHSPESEKKRELRRNPPALWAGYVLHGDWR